MRAGTRSRLDRVRRAALRLDEALRALRREDWLGAGLIAPVALATWLAVWVTRKLLDLRLGPAPKKKDPAP